MLKKTMIAAAAVLGVVTGAAALDASPARAGVTIQLAHGFGPAWGYPGWRNQGQWRPHRRHWRPRHGHFGPRYRGRPACFTKYKTVKVRDWHPRKHRWVIRKVSRPVTVCR